MRYAGDRQLADKLIDVSSHQIAALAGVAGPAGDIVRGQAQTACQILIASARSGLTEGKADSWDSGIMRSSQSSLVAPTAPLKLNSASTYYWTVRIWDQNG